MTKFVEIENTIFINALALLEEMQNNGENTPESLFAWWNGEQDIIQQTISELKSMADEYNIQ